MPTATTSTLLALAAAVALIGVAGLSGPVGTHAIGRQDVRELKARVRKDPSFRNATLEAARRRLTEEADGTEAAIRTRLLTELDAYIDSMRGDRFLSVDAAFEEVQRRERILCFSVQSWPTGFASGRLLTFVVDEADAATMRDKVPEVVLQREIPLRSTVRDLVQRRELMPSQARALRDFTRGLATVAAKEAIDEIRGGAFFSRADAELFVENAAATVIDRIHSRVQDPASRPALLDEASTAFRPAGG